jgi:predicted acylesterase/phospholipase RssA
LALLTDAPRSGTVVARRDSTLVRLDRRSFEQLTERYPDVMSAVAKGLAFRLQESRPVNLAPPHNPKVVGLVPVGDGVALEVVAALFERALAEHVVVEQVGPTAPPGALQAAEARSDRVLLVGGGEPQWDRGVVRQADRLVLVTRDPEPAAVPDVRVDCDVVLVGPRPTQAQVVGWHDATGCRRVHHLGEDPARWGEGLRPLLSRLSGTSVALVLAGGGARSLAHLGVLYALEEAGIVVDRVAGTSMGGFIASLYATGAGAAEVDARIFEEFVQRNPFADYRPSMTSLARGDRGRAMLRRCFGDSRMEELDRELIVVSTDLYERVPVYHRRGLTMEAVGASMCLPVLFPPQRLDGRVLVDGTLTDNCPTGPYGDVPEGPVIAVRIGGGSSRPHGTRTPTLGETLMRILQMADRKSDEHGIPGATVTVTPDTRGVGLLEFHQIDVARESGRVAGDAVVEALRERRLAGMTR